MSTKSEDIIAATKPKPMCVIPARKGSKRIKNKNMRLFCGKPLIQYTIEAAIDSGVVEPIIVSTDDLRILEFVFGYFDTGIIQPHKCPKSLSTGEAGILRYVCRWIFSTYGAREEFCLLQPTSPLRTAEDIKSAYNVFRRKKVDYLASVSKRDKDPFKYDNGAILFAKSRKFLEELPFNCIGTNAIPWLLNTPDIDTEEDWQEAERLMRER